MGKSLAVAFSAGLITLFFLAATRWCLDVFIWVPRRRGWTRAALGQCRACGYDLTANITGTRPECGAKIPPHLIADRPPRTPFLPTELEPQPWWVWVAAAAAMLLALFLQRSLWP